MSYVGLSTKDYQTTPPGVPGWQFAPVPGWGYNPARAGAPIIATGNTGCGCGSTDGLGANDSEEQANQGYIALAAAGGLFLGWFLGWFYLTQVKGKKS